jgi:hypothetical protein
MIGQQLIPERFEHTGRRSEAALHLRTRDAGARGQRVDRERGRGVLFGQQRVRRRDHTRALLVA